MGYKEASPRLLCNMSIRQINATYTPDEDRILLRVTLTEGDELRFWLTRASRR